MNKWIFVLLMLTVAKLPAQTNAPVRLGIVSESDETKTAADVLTAQLSGNGRIQLLERDQIEKVYHEQGLSAANRNDLKLGRILGADGLLLLNVVRTPQQSYLMARLIAVKPGVVLTDGSFPWPVKNTTEWAESVTAYINSFLPKLTVLAKDAIPISVVNLRAAISSAGEKETERDLKLLTIQRLSQERRLFVLERQKMQLLSKEKELKSDESAFWDGSYLLDGIVDQNGYSKDTVTVNARLTPPKGGVPISFEVSGSRTNLSQVVNRLAAKVIALLNVHSTAPEWNATDEAEQYFQEAKWALKWGLNLEAQAAAESAWALGKKDLDCALVRVRAYVTEIPKVEQGNVDHYQSLTDFRNGIKDPHYVHINDLPDPIYLDCALYALKAYYQFSRLSPDGEPKVLTRGPGWNDWHDSDWYKLGIDALVAASQVLQQYYFNPQSQPPVADELADLRASARAVAELISQSPSVRDSYFVGDRIATRDELAHTMDDNPNIFRCEVDWGCFWQERPEDAIALYRQLMRSPVFCYIHTDFWNRKPIQPRLIGWTKEDQERIPSLWAEFIRRANDSTNLLWQLEAKALVCADANGDRKMASAFTNFFNAFFAYRDALVANHVELLYLDWGAGALLNTGKNGGIVTDTSENLRHVFYSEYVPKLEAMDQEYWQKTIPAAQTSLAFEKQKEYLAKFTPYDFVAFDKTFSSRDFTKAQAEQLRPLIDAYKSNMIEQASAREKFKAKADAQWIELFLGKRVNETLNPPKRPPAMMAAASSTHAPLAPAPTSPPKVATNISEPEREIVTNILVVTKFLKIPRQSGTNDISNAHIFAERWSEGKLLTGLEYGRQIIKYDRQGHFLSARTVSLSSIAIFDPEGENWNVVDCPKTSKAGAMGRALQNNDNRIILFHGDLFSCVDGPLKKYDSSKHVWINMEIPEQGEYDLFATSNHLYAASRNELFEIAGDGSTRILASTRRRPAVTSLDTLNSFESPQLFSGPDHSLCASIGKKIYRWDGNNWREILTWDISQPPEIFEDTVILRAIPYFGSDDHARLWIWNINEPEPKLALVDKPMPHPGIINPPFRKPDRQKLHPLWRSLGDDYLTRCIATFGRSNLYFFVDHASVTNENGHWSVMAKDGYHAKLVCLCRDLPEPIVIPLKFDVKRGRPPLRIRGKRIQPWLAMNGPALNTTMHFSRDTLFLSQLNTPGVWAIPVAQIESAMAMQKRLLLAQKARAVAAQEKHREALKRQYDSLLAKYDLNHNGRIDPEEKEAALADSVFIKSELDTIDANRNGRLDAEELRWFDANRNEILDPTEETAIETAQKLLAAKLIKDFDRNGDGQLDQNEFAAALGQNSTSGLPSNQSWLEFSKCDRNHNHELDARELQSYLEQYTLQDVRRKIFQTGPREPIFLPAHPHFTFKIMVEIYWHELAHGNRARPNHQQ